MALSNSLCGVGVAPGAAGNIGHPLQTPLTGTGTTQTGATPIVTSNTGLTPSAGNTAFALPSAATLMKEYYFFNPTAVAALVYPPVGGTINGGATNASYTVAANSFALFIAPVNALTWFAK